MESKKNILISGLPGIGKTTLIKKLCQELKHKNPIGFYSEEIRNDGQRKGFQLIGLNGQRTLFAHILMESNFHIGKYKVDVDAFDKFLKSIDFMSHAGGIVIIDEIGKMECMSGNFVKLIWDILDSDNTVVATISHTDGGIKGRIKQRDDIVLYRMNLDNREKIHSEILNRLNEEACLI